MRSRDRRFSGPLSLQRPGPGRPVDGLASQEHGLLVVRQASSVDAASGAGLRDPSARWGTGGSCEVLVYLKTGPSIEQATQAGARDRICMSVLPVIAGTDAACSDLNFRRGGNAT
jgi:hypothetical protein